MLIGSVVVHHPDFFCAGARADEGDLRGGNAGGTAGEAADDFVGELVRELADLRVGRRAAIDFADVVGPGGDYDFAGGFREIAEGDQVGVDLRRGPVEIVELGRNRGRLRGIEAGTDEVEDAAELQVVANYLREELRVRFGVIGARREIGDGHAWLFGAEAGATPEPILRGSLAREKQQAERENTNANAP